MNYPSEIELLEFFGVDPVMEDDVTFFTVSDSDAVELTLSYNVFDNSLQTSLKLRGRLIALVCQEGMNRFWIADDVLTAEFLHPGLVVRAKVKMRPFIQVEWSALRGV
jgi:hypothetical protein